MYRIVFTKQAAKYLQKLPHEASNLIRDKLALIANDPFAQHLNALKLQGRSGFRLRVGDWRVLYEIQNEELTVLVLKIAPRGEVYR